MAKEVTLEEGLKKQLSIGQVKEVMKILFTKLSKMQFSDVLQIFGKYNK